MACQTEGATLSAPYLNSLHVRPDQVFSEVSATIALPVLNFVPYDRRYEFLEKLQQESGVTVESSDSGDSCIIKGDFEQILLAKIKLEKYIIDLQMGCLGSQHGPDNLSPDGSTCWKALPPQNNNNNTIKLKKVSPGAMFDDQDHSNESFVVIKTEDNGADALKSRRKVGRPRKLAPMESNSVMDGQLFPANDIKLPTEEANSLSNTPALVITSVYNGSADEMMMENESKENGSIPVGTSTPSFNFEDEAERKAAEWLSVNMQQQQRLQQNVMEMEDRHSDEEMSFEYSCELCSFKAQREGQFLKHVLIHGKRDTVHKCDKCDFASVSLNHYNRHKLSHSDSIFKCPQCSYQTDEAKQLARHVTVKHTMIDNPPKRASILQCNECPYNTTKIYHFERHLLVHNRDLKGLLQVYHCDQCPYKTHRKEHFLRHRDNVHIRHRPYQCGMCSRSYKREDALQQHQVAAHNVYSQLSGNNLVDYAMVNGAASMPERNMGALMTEANADVTTAESASPAALGACDLSLASSLSEQTSVTENSKLILSVNPKSCKAMLHNGLGHSEESSCSSSSLPA